MSRVFQKIKANHPLVPHPRHNFSNDTAGQQLERSNRWAGAEQVTGDLLKIRDHPAALLRQGFKDFHHQHGLRQLRLQGGADG